MSCKTTIILTSTVNVNLNKCWLFQKDKNERLHTYLPAISQWLSKTNFNIVVVDNSGHNYDELNAEKELYKDRFEVITYTENELDESKYLANSFHKGESELFAIDYAYRHSTIIKQSTFIIKITCRYFIPDLENYLSKYDLNNYDCLSQSDRNRCEMVGSHVKNFTHIFNKSLLDLTGENIIYHIDKLWKDRISNFANILICEPFQIEPTQRGGINEVFYSI